MNNLRYPKRVQVQAVNQVIERKRSVAEYSGPSWNVGVSRIKRHREQEQQHQGDDKHVELRRLRAMLKRGGKPFKQDEAYFRSAG